MPSQPWVLSQKRFEEVASADEPLPKRIEPLLMLAHPVPPEEIGSAVVSASEPALNVPIEPLPAYRFVLDAVIAKKFVEVALVSVVLPFAVSVPLSVSEPSAPKVEVAVVPKYARPAESWVVEALERLERPETVPPPSGRYSDERSGMSPGVSPETPLTVTLLSVVPLS